MSGTVLITGAFGLVGTETVRRFAADGWRVIATAHRKAYDELPPRVETRWLDLTDPAQVRSLVAEVSPDVIVHLAAVIPPLVYCDAAFARRLNVGATASLVGAASDQPRPPRFVHASSTAIYGSRNPYRHPELLTLDTPLHPCELYGGLKLEAEECVRSSGMDWVVLRLGGVLSVDPRAMPVTRDIMYFTSALPSDGRVHSVDTRDVATAFAAAAQHDVLGETFLIGGDDSHLLRQGEIGSSMAAARGMPGLMPQGGPATPTTTTTAGIPARIGWMRPGRRRRCNFSTIRGPTCLPKCERRPAGSVIRYGPSSRWRGGSSNVKRRTANRRDSMAMSGRPWGHDSATRRWTPRRLETASRRRWSGCCAR